MKFLIPNEQNSFFSLALLAAVVLYPWLTIVHFQQKTRSCPTWVWIPPGKGFTLSWGECSSQSALVERWAVPVWPTDLSCENQGTKSPGVLAFCTTHTHVLETVGSCRPELSGSSFLTPCLALLAGYHFRGVWFSALAEREKSCKNGNFSLNLRYLFSHVLISHSFLLMGEVCTSAFRFCSV